MSKSQRRRIAAIASVVMLGVVAIVLVQVLLHNTISLVLGIPGLAVAVVGAWWVVTEVAPRRGIGAIVFVLGVVMVVAALTRAVRQAQRGFLAVVLAIAFIYIALWLARFSLTRPIPQGPSNAIVPPRSPTRPVLMCNPWSGGGKVDSFGLVTLAEQMGVEVVMLAEGLDLEVLTRDAVARGADCLGMAGGDGSQALVASVAVEHGLPFVCIPAGTRNHFALDLGIDRNDPRGAMGAFGAPEQRWIDYATVNDRLFVNNVSLGIYATIVQSDEYRDAKVEVTRSMLTEHLGRQSEPFDLQYDAPDEGREEDDAHLIMVSNNPYVLGASRDVAQRRHLDSGKLGVFAVSTRTGENAARLMTLSALGLRNLSPHWHEFAAPQFEVRSRSGTAYMGVDGEALEAETPLRFESHPLGLWMYVPVGNLEIAEKRRARDVSVTDLFAVVMGRG
ncbi:MAG: diacylglycerol/lipid kinase family protein [Acidimicrobiia bacterium]